MAPNRLLDLAELERADVRRVLRQMDRLVAGDPVSYLHPGKRWEYPWALERAGLRAGDRILDVGSGDSIFPVFLAKEGHDVTAIDLELDGSLGRRHGVSIDYVRAGACSTRNGSAGTCWRPPAGVSTARWTSTPIGTGWSP